MTLTFSCPQCGHTTQVDNSYAGQSGPCVSCGKTITVPGGAPAFAGSANYDPRPSKGSYAPIIIAVLAGGLVLMLICGGVLFVLFMPALQASREAARRNQCIYNSKQIAQALHNHHDIHARLPMASTAPVTGTPGNAQTAGYSWFVALLPFLGDHTTMVATYDEIVKGSNQFEMPPFDPQLPNSSRGTPLASKIMPMLVCASADGPQPILSDSAKEVYATVPMPAMSSYIANAASHLANNRGPAVLFPVRENSGLAGNGVLLFPTELGHHSPAKGMGLKGVTDGTSNTVFFCETKETVYAAWIDGQTTWGVAAWPENVEVPTADGARDLYLGWPDADVTSMTSLEVAQENGKEPANFYMAGSRFGGSINRQYGPSSNHAAGIVIHTFADGHIQAIRPDIDRNVYLRIFSRNGGEAIVFDDENQEGMGRP
jgi:hypothetical protein